MPSYLFPDISVSLGGILSSCAIKLCSACFMSADLGETRAKGLNLHINNRTVADCHCNMEDFVPLSVVCLTGSLVYWFLQTVQAQKIEPRLSRLRLLIMNQTLYHDRAFPDFFLSTSLWVFMCKRIPEDPYKTVGALLRNKPTSIEGFAGPTQR